MIEHNPKRTLSAYVNGERVEVNVTEAAAPRVIHGPYREGEAVWVEWTAEQKAAMARAKARRETRWALVGVALLAIILALLWAATS